MFLAIKTDVALIGDRWRFELRLGRSAVKQGRGNYSAAALLGDRKSIVRPHQGRQAVAAAGVAAGCVAMAGPGFGHS